MAEQPKIGLQTDTRTQELHYGMIEATSSTLVEKTPPWVSQN